VEREHEPTDREGRQERSGDVEAGLGVFDRVGTNAMVSSEGDGGEAMGSANTHGQVALSMIAAETNSPMMPPAPANPAQVPMALACSSRGSWW
jgi:hypothetical protein